MSKRSPFVTYSIEEIVAIEASTYIVQAGPDAYCHNGKFAFSKKQANTQYSKIYQDMLYKYINGTDSQKRAAKKILLNLRVLPLRIH